MYCCNLKWLIRVDCFYALLKLDANRYLHGSSLSWYDELTLTNCCTVVNERWGILPDAEIEGAIADMRAIQIKTIQDVNTDGIITVFFYYF